LQGPDWDDLYLTRVLPRLGVARGGHERPRWIFVCGQPGCGKSTLIGQLLAELDPQATQVLSSDAICDLLPELYADPEDPATQPLRDAYVAGIQQGYLDRLTERALDLRAHVLCERPQPADTAELAVLARALDYQVECLVLVLPPEESWLATLLRETGRLDQPGPVPRRIAWADQIVNTHRWPGFLAQAEAEVAFDRLALIRRDGEELFVNHAIGQGAGRAWANPPFAMESLVVERLAPRSESDVAALVAQWTALRAHPGIAFRNFAPWPHASFLALGEALQALAADPGTGFDLNAPGQGPVAAAAWLRRLAASLDAACASPDAPPACAPRAEQLLALVRQLVEVQG